VYGDRRDGGAILGRAWKDLPAARAGGMPLTAWTPRFIGCEAKSTLSWDDPLPFLRSTLHGLAGGRLGPGETGAWRGRNRTTS